MRAAGTLPIVPPGVQHDGLMGRGTEGSARDLRDLGYVRDLADRSGGLAELGGKGESLARLAEAGFPVPDGFHVTTEAHRRFLADGQLAPDLAAEILDAYHALGSPAVAVRSSATTEDQPGASYAGQHDSFLNVLRRCRPAGGRTPLLGLTDHRAGDRLPRPGGDR